MKDEQFVQIMYAIHKLEIAITNTNKLLDKHYKQLITEKDSNQHLNYNIGSQGILPSVKSTK